MSILDVLIGWEAVEDALPDYQEAENYYTGKVKEWFSSEKIRQRVQSTATKHRFNMAKIPVNTLADRVELVSVTDPASDEVTALIAEISKANNMDIHYPDLITKTFTFGDAYVQVWPVAPDAPEDGAITDAAEGPDDDLAEAGVEFVVHDPKNVRVIYDPANHRRKLFTIMRWPVVLAPEQEGWRVDIYYADTIERYQSKINGDLTREDGWEEFAEEDDITVEPVGSASLSLPAHILENPYGENPFFHYRTALPYGVPVHFPAYGCQDAINKALITQLNVMDVAGWPERYGLTEPGAELDQANDSPNDFDDVDVETDTSLQGGQVGQQRSGPGVFHEYKGMKEVGTFDAADPTSFLEPAAFYVRLMSQLTNTPLHRFDPTGELPSGESLKTAEAPLVKTAERQKTMASAPTEESWKFALRVLDTRVRTLDVQWAPSAAAVGVSDWEVVKAKQDAGVPIDQTLVEAGYDDKQVQGWLDEGAEELDLTRRVALLTGMADAIQKLAGAVATGVMTAEQTDAIITEFTGVKVKPAPPTQRVPIAARPPVVDPNAPKPVVKKPPAGGGDPA